MFASALLVNTRPQYDAIMKQAVGRCDRFGQRKTVHVYHFLMAKTVEVNIWQARHDAKIVGKRGAWSTVELDGEPGDWEGPGLEGAACGTGDILVDTGGAEQ